MKPTARKLLLLLSFTALIAASPACHNGVSTPPPANPAFNGTFSGVFQINTPSGPVMDTVTMDLSVNSPLGGSIFFSAYGYTGTITGDASGDQATFTITITGPCPGTLQGTMTVVTTVNGDSITVDVTGSTCDGLFGFSGTAGAVEICDDNTDNDGDGLTDCADADCISDPACPVMSTCGDGTREGSEQCDDGNTNSCDGCSDLCISEAGLTCGDGTLAMSCGETCDDGNTMSCDGCSGSCQLEAGLTCGDGILNNSCGETCDDGNANSCDGCSDTCQPEVGLVCGDGILNATCGEQCDDGNNVNGDGCDSMCMTEGGCAGAAASDPSVADCPSAAPAGGCAFDVTPAFSSNDFTCNDVCSALGYTCANAFDGDFTFCQPLSAAQACSVPVSMIGGQPDMHCHCI